MSDHPSFDNKEGEDFLQLGFDIHEAGGEEQAEGEPEPRPDASPRPQPPKPSPGPPGAVPYRPGVGEQAEEQEPARPAMPKAPAPGEPARAPEPVITPGTPPPPALVQSETPTPVSEPPAENLLAQHILSREDAEPEEREDTPETALVRKLTGALAKAVKAAQLYPVENPMCRKFAEELMARINDTFQAIDVIRLSVGKKKLFYAGDPVLEQEGRDESVPGRLFWAGLREISFHVGLTSQEVLDFLSTFRNSNREQMEGEGDMVTLLWDAHFEHITYIAVDDLLDLENSDDPIPEEFGSDFMNFVDLDMHNLEEEEETERMASEMAEQIRSRMNQEDPTLFGITQEERDALLAEIEEEESPKMLHDILNIIYETLLLETDESSFMELVQVMSGAMLALLGEGRLGEAAEVISMLQKLKNEGQGDPHPDHGDGGRLGDRGRLRRDPAGEPHQPSRFLAPGDPGGPRSLRGRSSRRGHRTPVRRSRGAQDPGREQATGSGALGQGPGGYPALPSLPPRHPLGAGAEGGGDSRGVPERGGGGALEEAAPPSRVLRAPRRSQGL